MDLIFRTILYEQGALLAPDDFLLANLLHPSTLLSPRPTFSLISHLASPTRVDYTIIGAGFENG